MARSRYRSVLYGLEASLELARAVVRAGGRTDVDHLARSLGYSGVRNGAFLSRLANARLFGLVAGGTGDVVLSERGRRCLSADTTVSSRALAEACMAVPLFHRVLESFSGHDLGDAETLARVLEQRFGETPAKAGTAARILLESASRAGLIRDGRVDLFLVRDLVTDFTDLPSAPGRMFVPPVGSWRPHLVWAKRRSTPVGNGGRSMVDDAGAVGSTAQPSEEGNLWVDGPPESRRSRVHGSRVGIVLGTAACLILVGLPIGLVLGSGSGPSPHTSVTVGGVEAKHSVLSALSATTESGSFSFRYQLSETPYENPAAAGVTCAPTGGICGAPSTEDNVVQGSGTINTNPIAMATSADISSNGAASLQVGVRVDPTTVWEVSDTDNGLTPAPSDGSGQALSGFASLVEGTLGQREGAVAMLGMASPTGFLDLDQPAVTTAAEVGPSTVDGVAVTQYELVIDPKSLASASGLSSEEQSTIDAAIQVLADEGYSSIRDQVSIDASGFIRESTSTVTFGGGGTVTLDAHFSNFGCAGTVLMPGQGGSSTPPVGCTSPDTGVAPATPTTTTTSTTPTTSTQPAATPTTVTTTVGSTTTPSSSPPSSTTSTTTTTSSS
jgi:hypothetical protein